MTITREELIKTRIALLKQMNKYIIDLGDEEIWLHWISVGVPDEPSENDYEFIAENEDEWIDTCKVFGQLVHIDETENY